MACSRGSHRTGSSSTRLTATASGYGCTLDLSFPSRLSRRRNRRHTAPNLVRARQHPLAAETTTETERLVPRCSNSAGIEGQGASRRVSGKFELYIVGVNPGYPRLEIGSHGSSLSSSSGGNPSGLSPPVGRGTHRPDAIADTAFPRKLPFDEAGCQV